MKGNAAIWQSSLAAEGTGSLRLNIFGEGEAPGFVDTSTSANFANGRPLTSTFGDGSASDIFIRNAPVTGDGTLSEIALALRSGIPVIGIGTWTLLRPDGEVDSGILPMENATEAAASAVALATG